MPKYERMQGKKRTVFVMLPIFLLAVMFLSVLMVILTMIIV